MSTISSLFCTEPEKPDLQEIIRALRVNWHTVKVDSGNFSSEGQKLIEGWPYSEWDFSLSKSDGQWILDGTIRVSDEENAVEFHQYLQDWKQDVLRLKESPERNKVLQHLDRTRWTMLITHNTSDKETWHIQDDFLEFIYRNYGAIVYHGNLQEFVLGDNEFLQFGNATED